MMATVRGNIARSTGTNRITQFKKSAQKSTKAFVDALRAGSNKARKALGLRSATKGRTTRNLVRRRSTGGSGG